MNALVLGLRNLGPARLAALGLVAAAMIGFFLYLGNRVTTPAMGLLYSGLDLKDSGEIVQKLDAMGVPYQLRGDGTQLLVPADQVARLRMAMAETGLPRGGGVGYEIFDKSEGLGTSSFVQSINQLRALEGELARTISSLGPVSAARVHLVLPRRELFSRDRQEPTASIVLTLRGAGRLSKGQVAAIQHLVASAVPRLKPNRVSIIDQDGNLLASGDGSDGAGIAATNAEEMRVSYENRLSRAVEQMLARSVGAGNVRVEVHADMDFDRETTNTETYDPDGQVVRSTQTVEDQSNSSEAGDQPVTVANNLPNSQQATNTGGGKSKNAHSEETVNYEISKTVKSHVREGGIVRRLSVAVLVDGTYKTAADGTKTYQPRPPEELQKLATLVRSAIGYNEKRGDTVQVVNLRFVGADEHAPVATPEPFFGLTKAELIRIGETLVLALIGLLVMLFVVRPFLTGLAANLPVAATAEAGLLTNQTATTAALPPPASAPASAPIAGVPGSAIATEDVEEMIDLSRVEGRVKASSLKKIGEIIEKHPEETVAIMRNWMYSNA